LIQDDLFRIGRVLEISFKNNHSFTYSFMVYPLGKLHAFIVLSHLLGKVKLVITTLNITFTIDSFSLLSLLSSSSINGLRTISTRLNVGTQIVHIY